MATFTMEFRKYLEYYGTDYLGFSTYPIFDEDHREVLNQKIIDRFFHREIGTETPEVFSHRMKRKLNEIMPRYNQLYATEKLVFDPISTIDIRTTATNHEDTSSEALSKSTGSTTDEATALTNTDSSTITDTEDDGTTASEATGTGTNASRSVASQTPQTMLSGDGDYATSAQDNNSQSSTTSDSTTQSNSTSHGEQTGNSATDEIRSGLGTSESDTTATQSAMLDGEKDSVTKGYQGYPADLLKKFRATILNIDLDILNELDELFMQIWNTSDNYTNNNLTINHFRGYY